MNQEELPIWVIERTIKALDAASNVISTPRDVWTETAWCAGYLTEYLKGLPDGTTKLLGIRH
jgi:hypothetical protein